MVRVRVQQKRKPGCVVGVRLQLGSQRKVRAARRFVLRHICTVGQRWGLSPSLSCKAGFGFGFGLGLSERESLEVWLEWCSKWQKTKFLVNEGD